MVNRAGKLPLWASSVLAGAVAALRLLLITYGICLVLSTIAWFTIAGQLVPVGVIPGWALGTLVWTVGFHFPGTELTVSLPPTVLSGLFAWGAYRQGRALLNSEDTDQPLHRERLSSLFKLFGFAVISGVVVTAGVLFRDITPTTLELARAVLLVVLPVAIGLRAGQVEVLDFFERYLGSEWARAGEEAGAYVKRSLLFLIITAHLLLLAGIIYSVVVGNDLLPGYSSVLMAGIGVGVLQAVFAPTIWTAALVWASGLPVTLSGGANYSALAGSEAPRPAIPVMGLAPAEPAPWLVILVAAPVLAVAGSVLANKTWYATVSFPTLATAAAMLAGIGLVLTLFVRGGIGPGGLLEIGPTWWATPVACAIWALAGYGLAYGLVWVARRD